MVIFSGEKGLKISGQRAESSRSPGEVAGHVAADAQGGFQKARPGFVKSQLCQRRPWKLRGQLASRDKVSNVDIDDQRIAH
jgi:hypothetical protein